MSRRHDATDATLSHDRWFPQAESSERPRRRSSMAQNQVTELGVNVGASHRRPHNSSREQPPGGHNGAPPTSGPSAYYAQQPAPSTSRGAAYDQYYSTSQSRRPATSPAAQGPTTSSNSQSHTRVDSRGQQKPHPQIPDPYAYLSKRAGDKASPQSSAEKVAQAEAALRHGYHQSRSGQQSTNAHPSSSTQNPPTLSAVGPADNLHRSLRQREKERDDREFKRREERAREKLDQEREKEREAEKRRRKEEKERLKYLEERAREKEKRDKEKEKLREKDRLREQLAKDEQRRLTRTAPLYPERIKEVDSSDSSRRRPPPAMATHRRHQTDDGTGGINSAQWDAYNAQISNPPRAPPASNTVNFPSSTLTNVTKGPSEVVHPGNSADRQPSDPRAREREKVLQHYRTQSDRVDNLRDGTVSGSDNEKKPRREQRPDGNLPDPRMHTSDSRTPTPQGVPQDPNPSPRLRQSPSQGATAKPAPDPPKREKRKNSLTSWFFPNRDATKASTKVAKASEASRVNGSSHSHAAPAMESRVRSQSDNTQTNSSRPIQGGVTLEKQSSPHHKPLHPPPNQPGVQRSPSISHGQDPLRHSEHSIRQPATVDMSSRTRSRSQDNGPPSSAVPPQSNSQPTAPGATSVPTSFDSFYSTKPPENPAASAPLPRPALVARKSSMVRIIDDSPKVPNPSGPPGIDPRHNNAGPPGSLQPLHSGPPLTHHQTASLWAPTPSQPLPRRASGHNLNGGASVSIPPVARSSAMPPSAFVPLPTSGPQPTGRDPVAADVQQSTPVRRLREVLSSPDTTPTAPTHQHPTLPPTQYSSSASRGPPPLLQPHAGPPGSHAPPTRKPSYRNLHQAPPTTTSTLMPTLPTNVGQGYPVPRNPSASSIEQIGHAPLSSSTRHNVEAPSGKPSLPPPIHPSGSQLHSQPKSTPFGATGVAANPIGSQALSSGALQQHQGLAPIPPPTPAHQHRSSPVALPNPVTALNPPPGVLEASQQKLFGNSHQSRNPHASGIKQEIDESQPKMVPPPGMQRNYLAPLPIAKSESNNLPTELQRRPQQHDDSIVASQPIPRDPSLERGFGVAVSNKQSGSPNRKVEPGNGYQLHLPGKTSSDTPTIRDARANPTAAIHPGTPRISTQDANPRFRAKDETAYRVPTKQQGDDNAGSSTARVYYTPPNDLNTLPGAHPSAITDQRRYSPNMPKTHPPSHSPNMSQNPPPGQSTPPRRFPSEAPPAQLTHRTSLKNLHPTAAHHPPPEHHVIKQPSPLIPQQVPAPATSITPQGHNGQPIAEAPPRRSHESTRNTDLNRPVALSQPFTAPPAALPLGYGPDLGPQSRSSQNQATSRYREANSSSTPSQLLPRPRPHPSRTSTLPAPVAPTVTPQPPQPLRQETLPAQPSVYPLPGVPRSHKLSDPERIDKVAVSANLIAVTPQHQLPPQSVPSRSTDSEILKTPSSLAQQDHYSIPVAPQISSSASQESKKRGSFFNTLFRPKPTGYKPQDILQQSDFWEPPTQIKSSREAAPQTHNLPKAEGLGPSSGKITKATHKVASPMPSRVDPSAPVALHIPVPPMSGRKSPGRQGIIRHFLNPKRYRTVSSASVEAVDGTANNTVLNSPTASTLSVNPPIPPIPSRDPILATTEWRNKAEEQQSRGAGRRPRPGVTFEEVENQPERFGPIRPPSRQRRR
ncbi:hypothetical protein JAAARDRAFT_31669 [Jaapia argillacea MUCL 33604]|uniref:Uncharacterized protein n=1 Tax=Jaapia argillacea MUCL 33604 TaxID=933084 RepID=A0A067Q143_9AGAM|nr:hypothetical protein JAAARDRAFT_31669 [Jaapia argillacea MUCL 33604]